MTALPWNIAMSTALILFLIGMAGLIIRRNVLFILMSIEIMLNAAGLAFIIAGARWGRPDGQVMFIFILTAAAAEVAVGLALILQMHLRLKTLNVDAASKMRG